MLLLARQAEPLADEERIIVQMLYEHLPTDIRSCMIVGEDHTKIAGFQSRLEDASIEFRQRNPIQASIITTIFLTFTVIKVAATAFVSLTI